MKPKNPNFKYLPYFLILLAILGIIDASYLTYEHYAHIIPPCTTNWWIDCGKVLNSSYAMFLGLIPLALLGLFQYSAELLVVSYVALTKNRLAQLILLGLTLLGTLFSLYFVYLMIFVLHAICLYCFYSAIISFLLFIFTIIMIKYP